MIQAAGLSGAIFTTDASGTVVNGNTQYASKCDVYLDGGPGPNAPAHAAGLPAGDYYFQVTDPNGSALLSTDPVSNRRFKVSSDGVIVQYTGVGGPAHPTGVESDHPELFAITIRLANTSCPTDFKDTPNNGGVYKVWVTRVADFVGNPALVDNACGNGCYHGFVPSKSKTDDFKAKATPVTTTFCLDLRKETPDHMVLSGWQFELTDPLGGQNTLSTDEHGQILKCGLPTGEYTVREIGQSGWHLVAVIVNGTPLPLPSLSYTFTTTSADSFVFITYQNEMDVLPN